MEDVHLLPVRQQIQGELRKMPRDGPVLASNSGNEERMFSILAPRKYKAPHRGQYRGALRYHLGLMIPEPEGSSRIRVENDVRAWNEGKSMIFDDSNEHEVWNDNDSYRVVLFVDFVRPTIFPLSMVNRSITRAGGRYLL